jgi:hypothetical protein
MTIVALYRHLKASPVGPSHPSEYDDVDMQVCSTCEHNVDPYMNMDEQLCYTGELSSSIVMYVCFLK